MSLSLGFQVLHLPSYISQTGGKKTKDSGKGSFDLNPFSTSPNKSYIQCKLTVGPGNSKHLNSAIWSDNISDGRPEDIVGPPRT